MLSDMTSAGAGRGVRQQRKERTRRELLDAARRVLRRHGLAAATTREIAAEAGVAAGTFFVHFPDMNVLVETLLDEVVAAGLRAGVDTMPAGNDLVGELVHVSRCLYESYDQQPELARQFLSASLFRSSPGGPAQQRIEQFRRWVGARIEGAVAARVVPAIDPDLGFYAYFALYFGFLTAGLRGELDRSRQLALLESALRRLFLMEVTS